MKPVTFGNKRALEIKSINSDKCRFQVVLRILRNFNSVKIWENNNSEDKGLSYQLLSELSQKPYLVRGVPEKRDKLGNIKRCTDYFLLLTKINESNICFLIEKKKPLDTTNIYQIRFCFKDYLFKGTLFVGTFTQTNKTHYDERVKINYYFLQVFTDIGKKISAQSKTNSWIYLINDMWEYPEKNINSLVKRITKIQDIINKEHKPDSKLDVCNFEIVQYFNYNEIEEFLRYGRSELSYKLSDQLVVFVHAKGILGEDEHLLSIFQPIGNLKKEEFIFKNGTWKLRKTKVNDQKDYGKKEGKILKIIPVSNYPDVYSAFEGDKELGIISVRSLKDSEKMRDLFKNKKKINLLCKWNEEFQKWYPVI